MTPVPTACMMLHSVGLPDPGWVWRDLTMPWGVFEKMLRWLRRMGYRSLSLDGYREMGLAGRLGKERAVAFTFDDGYLDNWVYAAPLLETYGFTGTVFMPTDFIDPGEQARPQRAAPDRTGGSPASGFLNKAELRLLDHSGVLSVESHAVTHTWYPSGPRIVDFRHPGDSWLWMNWNANPAGKWQSLAPECPREAWGEPVYEHKKSLEGPRFYPDPAVAEELCAYAASRGRDFFTSPGWREELRHRAEEARRSRNGGAESWESEEAFLARAEEELTRSAAVLGDLLGRKIRHLCWPGGGYTPKVFALASRYYATTTIASADSSAQAGPDASGCFRIRRFGPLTTGRGAEIRYLGPFTNSLYVEERRSGSRITRPLVRLVRGGLTRFAQWGIL